MLRNQAGFIAARPQPSRRRKRLPARRCLRLARGSQAYTMFGSASRGMEGYNEKLQTMRVGERLPITRTSKRQANEVNTDSQVGRKHEWSRGIGAVPIVGPPADVIREGVSGIVSSASDGKHGALL